VLSRFLSKAPYPVYEEHPYIYVLNNPINFIDSTGKNPYLTNPVATPTPICPYNWSDGCPDWWDRSDMLHDANLREGDLRLWDGGTDIELTPGGSFPGCGGTARTHLPPIDIHNLPPQLRLPEMGDCCENGGGDSPSPSPAPAPVYPSYPGWENVPHF